MSSIDNLLQLARDKLSTMPNRAYEDVRELVSPLKKSVELRSSPSTEASINLFGAFVACHGRAQDLFCCLYCVFMIRCVRESVARLLA